MTAQMLSARALNRALLARQGLLERWERPLAEVVEGMGGIQMQYAPAGYIALWSRMRGFRRPMLTAALEERAVVQGTMMRVTIHTVSAGDYWPIMAGVRRSIRDWTLRVRGAQLAGVDMPAAAATVRELLADAPMRMAELVEALERRGVPEAAARSVGAWIDLVRVPPAGTWDRRRADLYGLAETWLPPVAVPEDEGVAHLVRRYLGAFGPAPVRDVAAWMGVRVGRVRPIVERMELAAFRDEAGRALIDLPGAPLPDPETPAPPRFIGVWDAMLLAHARRTGVLPEPYRPRIFGSKTPHSFNTFLLDGRVAGTWQHLDGEIRLGPFGSIPREQRAALEDEAHRLAILHASRRGGPT